MHHMYYMIKDLFQEQLFSSDSVELPAAPPNTNPVWIWIRTGSGLKSVKRQMKIHICLVPKSASVFNSIPEIPEANNLYIFRLQLDLGVQSCY